MSGVFNCFGCGDELHAPISRPLCADCLEYAKCLVDTGHTVEQIASWLSGPQAQRVAVAIHAALNDERWALDENVNLVVVAPGSGATTPVKF